MECENFRILLKQVSNHLSLLFQFACLKLKNLEKKWQLALKWIEKTYFFLKSASEHGPWVSAFAEKAYLIIWSSIDKVLVIKHQAKMIMAWNFENVS